LREARESERTRRLKMFTLPQIMSLPVLSGLDAGVMQWPTIGAVLAALLIAALVGAALGLLREGISPTRPGRAEEVAEPRLAAVADDHRYCKAA
jgi:amino acid transporter